MMAKWRDFVLEMETPSNKVGPLHHAYERAVIGMAHGMLGACFAWMGHGLLFALALSTAYWLVKEWGDLRRGGGVLDGIEDAAMVSLGAFYGPPWWPAMMVLMGAYLMAVGAWRE